MIQILTFILNTHLTSYKTQQINQIKLVHYSNGYLLIWLYATSKKIHLFLVQNAIICFLLMFSKVEHDEKMVAADKSVSPSAVLIRTGDLLR